LTAAGFSETSFSSAGDAGFSEKPATPRAIAAGFFENQVPPAIQMKLHQWGLGQGVKVGSRSKGTKPVPYIVVSVLQNTCQNALPAESSLDG
jgi:hypothetical protein